LHAARGTALSKAQIHAPLHEEAVIDLLLADLATRLTSLVNGASWRGLGEHPDRCAPHSTEALFYDQQTGRIVQPAENYAVMGY
jgi:hypothetical protein